MLPIKAGDQLKHYRILEKLGEGGMGVVYRAEDIRLGRHVAIKFLPTDAAHDPALRKRFQQEARAAAAISHPAIATVFDVGEDNDQSYIVFEFVPGTTLRTFVKPGGVGLEPLYGRPGVRWHCRTNAQARVGRNWFHHGI